MDPPEGHSPGTRHIIACGKPVCDAFPAAHISEWAASGPNGPETVLNGPFLHATVGKAELQIKGSQRR